MNHNDAEKQFVFVHRDLQYALPVMRVLEIVEMPSLLPSHGALPGCLGNISHRNYLLPVLDTTALVTRREVAPTASKTFIVVRDDEAIYGLAMDRFVAVVPLDAVGRTDNPSCSAGADAGDNPFVETVRGFRDNALILLSASAIGQLVKRGFTSQQLMTDNGETQADRTQAIAESERRIYLCARIDRALFGIPVEQVIEVIEGYDVTPLFQVPAIVRGLINLRGRVLACLDVSDELGFRPRPLEERSQFVVLGAAGDEMALCVDKVTGIRRLPPERVQNAEMVLSGGLTRYTAGVIEEEDGALFVLSVPALFDTPQLEPYRRQEG